jgi:hypothetical protein
MSYSNGEPGWFYVSGFDIPQKDSYGCIKPGPRWFPVYHAVDKGALVDVRHTILDMELLNEVGFIDRDMFFTNNHGERISYGTPLRRAIRDSESSPKIRDQLAVVRLLLQHGANPNAVLEYHPSILETATILCDNDVVNLLVSYGAKFDAC